MRCECTGSFTENLEHGTILVHHILSLPATKRCRRHQTCDLRVSSSMRSSPEAHVLARIHARGGRKNPKAPSLTLAGAERKEERNQNKPPSTSSIVHRTHSSPLFPKPYHSKDSVTSFPSASPSSAQALCSTFITPSPFPDSIPG